jgi:purine nucleosidase
MQKRILPGTSMPLIIDCDPGIDDAVALLLAFAHPDWIEVLGISTVAGNVPLETTTNNARKVCELAGQSLPIFAGCSRPLLVPPLYADHVHGASGLGGAQLPEPTGSPRREHGVDWLIETLRYATEPIGLATLGPLTNLALAIVKEPSIVPNIAQLVIMGGAIEQGNVTPFAEFNFYADPHAAQIVLNSGLPIVLIPLDVTHQAIATTARRDRIRAIGNRVSETVLMMIEGYGLEEQLNQGWDGPPLHDACVIAYWLRPELFEVKSMAIEIELAGDEIGRSRVLEEGEGAILVSRGPANVQVAIRINADDFYGLLTESLASF